MLLEEFCPGFVCKNMIKVYSFVFLVGASASVREITLRFTELWEITQHVSFATGNSGREQAGVACLKKTEVIFVIVGQFSMPLDHEVQILSFYIW